jgi:hypothetical protein
MSHCSSGTVLPFDWVEKAAQGARISFSLNSSSSLIVNGRPLSKTCEYRNENRIHVIRTLLHKKERLT